MTYGIVVAGMGPSSIICACKKDLSYIEECVKITQEGIT
jgi:hypothetical protein